MLDGSVVEYCCCSDRDQGCWCGRLLLLLNAPAAAVLGLDRSDTAVVVVQWYGGGVATVMVVVVWFTVVVVVIEGANGDGES